jgi:Amt family ammonium transporter
VITPCAGHVLPYWAIVIGALAGLVCYGGVQLKRFFQYDDSLDAFGVHGVGGALGALLVGVFAFRPLVDNLATGLIYGGGQLALQAVGLLATGLYAFVMTLLIGYVIHKTMGLRVREEDEDRGLDLQLHGEEGYRLAS